MKIEKITEEDILDDVHNKTLEQYVLNLVSQEEIKDMKDHEVCGVIQSQDGQQRKLRVEDMRKNIEEVLKKLENKIRAINQVRRNIND